MKALAYLFSFAWIIFVCWKTNEILEFYGTPDDYCFYNSYAKDGDITYISDNIDDEGIILKIEPDGKVDDLFMANDYHAVINHKVDFVFYRSAGKDQGLSALFYQSTNDRGIVTDYYRVLTFDSHLNPLKLSDYFALPNGASLSGFSADREDYYLSVLSNNGQEITVYRLDGTILKNAPPNESIVVGDFPENRDLTALTTVMSVKSPEGRYYSEALYDNSELITRMDNDTPGPAFSLPSDVKSLWANRKLDFSQKMKVSNVSLPMVVMICILGVVLIVIFFIFFSDRNRLVYEIFAFEGVLICLTVFTFTCLSMGRSEYESEVYSKVAKNAQTSLLLGVEPFPQSSLEQPDFYDSSLYYLLQKRLTQLVEFGASNYGLVDMYMVRADTNILICASGTNNQSIVDFYGGYMGDMIQISQTRGEFIGVDGTQQGVPYYFYVTPLYSWNLNDYFLVSICSQLKGAGGTYLENHRHELFYTLLIFIVGSIVGIGFLVAQQMDLTELAKVLKMQAENKMEIKKPKLRGKECQSMWNSVCEIQKNITAMNRVKYLTFEAYFRFAPKNIEQILNKESILEVYDGDVKRFNGTIGLFVNRGIRTAGVGDVETLNYYVRDMEESLEPQGGILISASSDLSMVKTLFLSESKNSAVFGREFLHAMMGRSQKEIPDGSIFLHYAELTYGIVGTDSHSFAFITSAEAELLEKYSVWLSSLGLGLVVSESVKNREEISGHLRYIGFILEKDMRLKLYEVLDACSARIRQGKLEQEERFNRALALFYNKDYYLARNEFMEVLQRVPEDDLTRWYLFECETYLNEDGAEDFNGRLHFK